LTQRENYIAASSRITDADIAQESARLTSTQIRQQGASAVLAQANQSPALVLQLLG
jgi:flagellin